jgi:hypothetical protein
MRTGNTWVVAGIVVLMIAGLALLDRGKTPLHRNRTLFSWVFPPLVLLFITLVVTHSTYQTAKVMQFIAPLWPVFLYLLFLPYIDSDRRIFSKINNLKSNIIAQSLLIFIMVIIIFSGLYAMVYIGKPVLASDLTLKNLESQLCSSPQKPFLILSRDEWNKYFLMRCEQTYFYFDRGMDWDRLVAFNKHNNLIVISQPCTPASLNMPSDFAPKDETILVDQCIGFSDPRYTLAKKIYPYNLYIRKPVIATPPAIKP